MTDNSLNKITPSFIGNSEIYSNPRYDDFKVIKVILSPNQVSSITIENFSIVFVNNGKCLFKNASEIGQNLQVNQFETIFVERNTELKIENLHQDSTILFIATF